MKNILSVAQGHKVSHLANICNVVRLEDMPIYGFMWTKDTAIIVIMFQYAENGYWISLQSPTS